MVSKGWMEQKIGNGISLNDIAKEAGVTKEELDKLLQSYALEQDQKSDYTFEDLQTIALANQKILRQVGGSHPNTYHQLRIKTDKPIALVFIADIHVGAIECALSLLFDDIEIMKKTDRLFVILGGDSIDNYIQPSKMSGVLESGLPIVIQWEILEEILKKLKNKVLTIGTSCHQDWQRKVSGFDYTEKLAEKYNLLYTGWGATIDLFIGDQKYTIHKRHKMRVSSMYNIYHGIQQLYRFGDSIFDLGISEHKHTGGFAWFEGHGQPRLALHCGTYKITDWYLQEHAYPTSLPITPTVIFYPDRKKMLPFLTVRDAIAVLKHEI